MPINNNILNQKGTPAFYSDIFANRPTYGYTGRVFISTDTGAIYEDTGTSWTLIADAGAGTTGTLQQVTTNGNTTTLGIVVQGININDGAGTGANNIAIGSNSLIANTTGLQNIGLGSATLQLNTTSSNNTAIGSSALTLNTIGSSNTAIGSGSLSVNISGTQNTAIGVNSGSLITTGSNNTILGNYAGTSTLASNIVLSDGAGNVRLFSDANGLIGINQAVGSTIGGQLDIHTAQTYALVLNGLTTSNAYTAFSNASVGQWRIGNTYNAGANTFDIFNLGTSSNALSFNKTSNSATFTSNVTASGAIARGILNSATLVAAANSDVLIGLDINTTYTLGAFTSVKTMGLRVDGINIGRGSGNISTNTAIGASALESNTTGLANTACGTNALAANTTGLSNTAFGRNAGQTNSTSSANTYIGSDCGSSNTTGSNNCFFGQHSGSNNLTGSNNVFFGVNAGRFITGGSTANTISTNSIFIGVNTRAAADNQTNQIVIGTGSTTGLGSNTTIIGTTATTTTALYGRLLLGSTTDDTTNQLQVTGSGKFTGALTSGTGLNISGNGGFFNAANKFGIDQNAGTSRLYASGSNASTRGAYEFHIISSDGSLDTTALSISNTGIINATSRGNFNGSTDNALFSLNSGGTLYTIGFSPTATASSTNTLTLTTATTTWIYTGTGTASWTLPTPSGTNQMFWIKNAGTGIITLNAFAGTNIIDNTATSVSSITIAVGATALIQQDGNVKSYQLQ
jgi:hypothetical protein